MACDVRTQEPFAGAHSLPVSFDVLEDVEVSEVVVWWIGFAICGA